MYNQSYVDKINLLSYNNESRLSMNHCFDLNEKTNSNLGI